MSDDETEDSRELLLKAHRKEKKELQAQVQVMKKAASKGDKKKKKELVETVAKLEEDLADKHKAQLDALDAERLANGISSLDVTTQEVAEVNLISEKPDTGHGDNDNEEEREEEEEKALGPLGIRAEKQPAGGRISKAQKRREMKAEKEKERAADIARQEEENKVGARQVEHVAIMARLTARGLTLHQIPSDGDCMFAGILHQLQLRGIQHSVQALRQATARELMLKKDEYLPFLTNPKTGEMLTEAEFRAYCEAMATSPAWGGQVELKALASVLQAPIQVVQAEGPDMVVGGAEYPASSPLLLSYHRHAYGLGEHYNSTRPL